MRKLALTLCAVLIGLATPMTAVQPADAQLMAWAILPRDDEMPAGYTFQPAYSHVYGLGNGVNKSYAGPFDTAWVTAADLFTSPYLAAVQYDNLVGSLRGKGMEVTTYGAVLGDAAFIATKPEGPNMKLMQSCFLSGRWIGCVLQRFHLTRGDGATQVALTRLMADRAREMP